MINSDASKVSLAFTAKVNLNDQETNTEVYKLHDKEVQEIAGCYRFLLLFTLPAASVLLTE